MCRCREGWSGRSCRPPRMSSGMSWRRRCGRRRCTTPSPGGSPPMGSEISLHADAGRQLTVADPDGREMMISCGAALFTARLALRSLGYIPETRVLPDPGEPTAGRAGELAAAGACAEYRAAAVRPGAAAADAPWRIRPGAAAPGLLAALREGAARDGRCCASWPTTGGGPRSPRPLQTAERA